MKVLIAGGSCLLGEALVRAAPGGAAVTRTWYANPVGGLQMDVCDESQVRYVMARARPDVVFHLASVGDVDWCERNYGLAERVIAGGTRALLKAARDHGARVVYASTNAVFGGDDPPYREDSPRRPVNVYGRLRVRAEDLVMKHSPSWAVARLFLLYGWPVAGARSNWAARLLTGLPRGERFRLVGDRRWQPTAAADAARALWALAEKGTDEVLHVAGPDRVSLHEFGLAAADACGAARSLVERISSDDLPKGTAERPLDASYDTAKLRSWGLRPVGVREGLRAMQRERTW